MAKADGWWQAAYQSQSTLTMPADFGVALEDNPRAAAFFNTLDRATRCAILYRIADAKRPEGARMDSEPYS